MLRGLCRRLRGDGFAGLSDVGWLDRFGRLRPAAAECLRCGTERQEHSAKRQRGQQGQQRERDSRSGRDSCSLAASWRRAASRNGCDGFGAVRG